MQREWRWERRQDIEQRRQLNIGPLGAALIGAGGLIGSSLVSSRGERRAADQAAQAQIEAAEIQRQIAEMTNQTNVSINAANIAARERELARQLEWARFVHEWERFVYNQQLLGETDATGSRQYFDPVRGWVTELSPRAQQVLDASLRQEILNRTIEDRYQRERSERLTRMQREESRQADSELDKYRNINTPTADALADLIYARGERGRTDAIDDALHGQILTMSRQRGSSNIPRLLSETAGQAGRDASTANIDALLNGLTLNRQLRDSDQTSRANLYSLFRGRATEPYSINFAAPFGVAGPDATTAMRAPGSVGAQGLITAAGGQGERLDYIQPDFSPLLPSLIQGQNAANQTRIRADTNAALIEALTTLGPGLYDWYNTRRNIGSEFDTVSTTSPAARREWL